MYTYFHRECHVTYMHTNAYTYICVYICIYMFICIYVYICVYICIYMYICIHISTESATLHKCIHMHTHIFKIRTPIYPCPSIRTYTLYIYKYMCVYKLCTSRSLHPQHLWTCRSLHPQHLFNTTRVHTYIYEKRMYTCIITHVSYLFIHTYV